jgi:glycerophosphoryl diester phosphodiesterase
MLAISGNPVGAADSPAEALLKLKRPLVIGHRGYPQFAPENTLPSFKLAVRAGADLVELDYYHARDGQPIVFHDGTLDRTSDATNRWGGSKIPVGSKTVAELQTLDAGRWFDAQFTGTRIPTLTEALETIQGSGGITLIERKEGDAATCAILLKDRALINQVVVQAFDWHYLKQFHDLEPTQVLGALGPPKLLADGSKPGDRPKALNAEWLNLVKASGAKLAVWNREVSREAVQQAHARGLKVWVYTINDAELATHLLDLGVEGLITDNPSVIWRAMALRNAR